MERFFGSRLGMPCVGNFCVLARNEAKATFTRVGWVRTYLPKCFLAKNRLDWSARRTTYILFTGKKPIIFGYRSSAIRSKCEPVTRASFISGFLYFGTWALIPIALRLVVVFCTAWRATRRHALTRIYLRAAKMYKFIWHHTAAGIEFRTMCESWWRHC